MAEKVSESAEAYLKAAGLEQDAMSRAALRLFVGADEAVERRMRSIEEARASVKANRITIAAVAEDMGVTRKTVHNNPVVHDYIVLRAKDAKDESDRLVRSLREKLADLEEQMEKLLRRDAEAEELKIELARMQGLLCERNALVGNLQEENAALRLRLAETTTNEPRKQGRMILLNPAGRRPGS